MMAITAPMTAPWATAPKSLDISARRGAAAKTLERGGDALLAHSPSVLVIVTRPGQERRPDNKDPFFGRVFVREGARFAKVGKGISFNDLVVNSPPALCRRPAVHAAAFSRCWGEEGQALVSCVHSHGVAGWATGSAGAAHLMSVSRSPARSSLELGLQMR